MKGRSIGGKLILATAFGILIRVLMFGGCLGEKRQIEVTLEERPRQS